MDWILKHKSIAIALVVVGAVAAWYFLSGSSASSPVLTTDQPTQAPEGTTDLLASLLGLRAVSLNSAIFSNPSFQILKDFSTPVVAEPAGRPDPFAPVGSDTGVGATGQPLQAPATQP